MTLYATNHRAKSPFKGPKNLSGYSHRTTTPLTLHLHKSGAKISVILQITTIITRSYVTSPKTKTPFTLSCTKSDSQNIHFTSNCCSNHSLLCYKSKDQNNIYTTIVQIRAKTSFTLQITTVIKTLLRYSHRTKTPFTLNCTKSEPPTTLYT